MKALYHHLNSFERNQLGQPSVSVTDKKNDKFYFTGNSTSSSQILYQSSS